MIYLFKINFWKKKNCVYKFVFFIFFEKSKENVFFFVWFLLNCKIVLFLMFNIVSECLKNEIIKWMLINFYMNLFIL